MENFKQRVLDRLDKQAFYTREIPSIKWNGKAEGLGLCPVHGDSNPSFSANRESGLFHCFACGKSGSIFDFYTMQHGGGFRGALEALAREAGVDIQGQGPAKKNSKFVAEYNYTDEAGKLLFQAVRYEPKDFRQRRPDGKGGWIWSLDGVRLVPYNLPEVLKAKSIIIVEGEKDCETLKAWGLTATTNAQGAGKWRREYNNHLKGKRVVILPDNDDPGRKHGAVVARNLHGIAESLKVVELPSLPHKGDVSDWIKQGGTRENLIELIKQTAEWTPPAEIPSADKNEQAASDEWPEIIPLNQFDNLPFFPADTLPAWCADMVESVAHVCQVDKGLPASVCLGALSACLGRKSMVTMGTHSEPLNLFLISILEPGNRKSAVVSLLTEPLYRLQSEIAESMADEIRRAVNENKIREARLKKLQTKAAETDNEGERRQAAQAAETLLKEIADNPVPKPPIYIKDGDISPEKLGDLMADNGERLAIISAEGGSFSIMEGLYSEGRPNLDIYLKGHAGDAWSCDRLGREGKSMMNPALTVCLAVQGDVVQEIGKNKRFRGRGLLARFLYTKCRPMVGYRARQTDKIPDSVIHEYARNIKTLLDLPDSIDSLTLAPDAQDLWNMVYNVFEEEMQPGSGMQFIKDWGSKLPGAVARIAGLLHCAEHGRNAYQTPISVNIVDAAARIGHYFESHAQATFGYMGEDKSITAAKLILEYLLQHRPNDFKGRAILQNKSALKSMDEVNPGLKILEERGYIRRRFIESAGPGRPEAAAYEVNPKLYTP